jgi:5-methylcytosine-specific restriction endonuclease McrBC GTP-binding regulatory subunit McrB
MEDLINLLKTSKNIVLSGAPGTGKTYLARKMALRMILGKSDENSLSGDEKAIFEEHYKFVQFHPSYDYTDFVEGLRAESKGDQVNFRLYDGIFKKFCKKASAVNKTDEKDFNKKYESFINDLSEHIDTPLTLSTGKYNKEFSLTCNQNDSCIATPLTGNKTELILTKERIRDYLENGNVHHYKSYLIAVAKYFKNTYNPLIRTQDDKPYIFVIDEINRGEISKIFGELFFSIDPSYRGNGDWKVTTQFSNLLAVDDIFYQGFYIPENIYIIGTMNDIDRSVESFDFAMRRRFTWVEIKAEDTVSMLNRLGNQEEEAKARLYSLNKAIWDGDQNTGIEGLNTAYHIGAAYFLKLENYIHESDNGFDSLWKYHIEPLLREYIRGMQDAEEKMDILKKSYYKPGPSRNNTDENNG